MKRNYIRLYEDYNNNDEEIPYWKQQMDIAKKKQALKTNYPDIGKIVRYKGDVGVVCFDPNWKPEDEYPDYVPGMYTDAYAVRWDTPKEFDYEQYGFFPYTHLDSYDFKYINMDGSLKK